MQFARSLHVIVTGVAACSLFPAGLAEGRHPCAQADWSLGVSAFAGDWGLVVSMCCAVGAVGAIWLAWRWIRLAGKITSIAERLKHDNLSHNHIKTKKSFVEFILKQSEGLRMTKIDELSKAVDERLDRHSNYVAQLEEQIKDLQIQIRLSQRQKRNTEAIIYSIRDAVIVIDEFDKLLMANEAAGKLFNFDFKNSQHRPIDELITPTDDSRREFVEFLRQSRRSKVRATKREIEFSSEHKKPRTFDCIIACVYDHRQADPTFQKKAKPQPEQVCGVVAVLHDITREKEISQMKSDFVSHVSHELKTPLASITAYSEMLFDGEADDEQTRKEFYSVIQSQAKRLSRLIEDVLNTSRIESGLIKVEKKPVSLTILIEEQMQMIKGYADEKNIELIGQKPIVFDQVYADKDMVSQVIVNLLSNAVKYTRPGGSIKIETEVDEIEGQVKVSVTDTGVGISKDELEHVFDKFYRVGANKSQAKGTGLGLNLVKQIIEKVHNGRVFVTSQPGLGSTFGFQLPLATANVVEPMQ